MADQYSVNAKFTADVGDYENGIKKISKSTKTFSKGLGGVIEQLGNKGIVKSMANLSLAAKGVTGAFSLVSKSFKKVSQDIKECTNLYKEQAKAEITLATAVSNSPLLDGTATKRLKEFASQMQATSIYGDEKLIPMLSKLITAGRSEAEATRIMQLALDMEAGGAMSLEQAINSLNGAMNGNIGLMGKQFGELKNLSAEELKAGKALDILEQKFKGMAEKTSSAVGSTEKLKNALGDFKEIIGGDFNKIISPLENAMAKAVTSINNAIKKLKEARKVSEAQSTGKTEDVSIAESAMTKSIIELTNARSILYELQAELKENELKIQQLESENNRKARKEIENLKTSNEVIQNSIDFSLNEIQALEQTYERTKANFEALKGSGNGGGQASEQSEINKLMVDNSNELEKQLRILEEQARIKNAEVSIEDKLNAYINSTNDLIANSGGLIQEGNFLYDSRLKIIRQLQSLINNQNSEEEEIIELEKDYYNIDYEISKIKANTMQYLAEQAKAEEKIKAEKIEQLQIEKKTLENEIGKDAGLENKIKDIKKLIKIYEELGEETKKIKVQLVTLQTLLVMKNVSSSAINAMNGIVKGFGKAGKTINNVAKTIGRGFINLMDFSIDGALDKLLEFEDKILTFFTETIHQLGSFFNEFMNSIKNVFSFVANAFTNEDVKNVIISFLTAISDNIGSIVDSASDIIGNIVTGIIDGIGDWIDGGGWEKLLDALLTIQKKLEKIVTDNVDKISKLIVKMIPKFMEMLKNSIVSASGTLGKIAPAIMEIVGNLINMVIDVITSPEVVQSSFDAVAGLVEAIVSKLLPNLIPAIIKIINFLALELPSYTPQLVNAIFKGFSDGLIKMDWKKLFSDIWQDFIDAFKTMWDSFTKSWSDVGSALDKNNDSASGHFAKGLLGLLTGGISNIFTGFATGVNNAPKGLALVGEKGPELIDFRGGERVYNAGATKGIMNSSSGGNSFNVTFNNLQDTSAYTMLRQLKAYNRQMAINGIL